jgi:hypothetical protein
MMVGAIYSGGTWSEIMHTTCLRHTWTEKAVHGHVACHGEQHEISLWQKGLETTGKHDSFVPSFGLRRKIKWRDMYEKSVVHVDREDAHGSLGYQEIFVAATSPGNTTWKRESFDFWCFNIGGTWRKTPMTKRMENESSWKAVITNSGRVVQATGYQFTFQNGSRSPYVRYFGMSSTA